MSTQPQFADTCFLWGKILSIHETVKTNKEMKLKVVGRGRHSGRSCRRLSARIVSILLPLLLIVAIETPIFPGDGKVVSYDVESYVCCLCI